MFKPRPLVNGSEPKAWRTNRAQSVHQSLQQTALLVMVAVADPSSPRVPPDLGGDKQKAQPCRRQGSVFHALNLVLGFAIEQQQPTVEVVRQHGQLKVVAVDVKAP